jgi:Domain of unknown function (DUF6798)
MPQHAKVTSWFGHAVPLQITVVVLAIYMMRRTKLFWILLLPLLAAMLLTIAQVITGNKGLALLFPWRISVFLVPIASSIVLASIVSAAFELLGKSLRGIGPKMIEILQAIVFFAIILIGFFGALRTVSCLNGSREGVTRYTRFVTRTIRPGHLYLVPPDMESFRLAARVPVFIDFRSHPYKGTEVVEWFHRIQIANEFYAASGQSACSRLENIADKYGTTHVILRSDRPIPNCGSVHELYRDSMVRIYELSHRR